MSTTAGQLISLSFQTSADSPRSLSPSSTAIPLRKGHYRPFSALNSPSPYIETTESPLVLTRSVGGLQQICRIMGMHFVPKGRREQTRTILPVTPLPSGRNRVPKKRPLTPASFGYDPSGLSTPGATPFFEGKRSQSQELIDKMDLSVSFEETMPKNIWAIRHNMKLHPYHKRVPYMQAYDPISLQSDRHTDLLLQRLSKGSPSFHDYDKTPPATALDLGCGPGYWLLHAANVWRSTKFIAFDLVDIRLPAFRANENVKFVLGDFVNYKLPFLDNSFDFVRMANLVLCIPYDKWEFVLSQVFRVLTPGGRLEIIDDQIYFPYGEAPEDFTPPLIPTLKPDSLTTQKIEGRRIVDDDHETLWSEDSADTDSTLLNEETNYGYLTAPSSPESNTGGVLLNDLGPIRRTGHFTLRRRSTFTGPTRPGDENTISNGERSRGSFVNALPPPPVHHQRSSSNPMDDRLPGLSSLPKSSLPSFEFRKALLCDKVAPCSHSGSEFKNGGQKTMDTGINAQVPMFGIQTWSNSTEPKCVVWQRNACAARNLEKMFEKMLTNEYGIHLQPAEFLVGVLRRIFCEEYEGRTAKAKVRKLKSFHIKLAPLDTANTERRRGQRSGSLRSSGNQKALAWDNKPEREEESKNLQTTSNWERKEYQSETRSKAFDTQVMTRSPSLTDYPLESQLQANVSSVSPFRTLGNKAAARLGISQSEPSEEESHTQLRARPKESIRHFASTPPRNPSMLSAKAADRLGIPHSELSGTMFSGPSTIPRPLGPRRVSSLQVSSAGLMPIRSYSPCTPSASSARPFQHTGLLIWPSTYIPMAPGEIEMHACKYIHTLLGCRPAIEDFVAKYVDEAGVRWLDEEEIKEEVWEYECFRRARFNWPSEASDPFEDAATNSNADPYISPPILPNRHRVADKFNYNKAKILKPNLFMRPSSPFRNLSHRRHDAIKPKVKLKYNPAVLQSASVLDPSRTGLENLSRFATPAPLPLRPSTLTHSSKENSAGKLAEASTRSLAKYQRNEPVHLRSIRVFEAVKDASGGLNST